MIFQRFFTGFLILFLSTGCLSQNRVQPQAVNQVKQKSQASSERHAAFQYYIADSKTQKDALGQKERPVQPASFQSEPIPGTNRVRQTVSRHPGYHYASNESFGEEQNIELMIEEKLYTKLEDAYNKRDQERFLGLYNFFLQSFPNTKRKAQLQEFMTKFFYQEHRRLEYLNGALVEITYPQAKTLNELNEYFRELKKNNISSVQMNVLNLLDRPVYLFADQKRKIGYYFPTDSNLTVDNILEKIVTTAHANEIKFYASFPLRHHPWIGSNEVYVMDESWNAMHNKTSPNSKLDLLNPQSRVLLANLLEKLLSCPVDGIIFKDDFTYDLYEGFSKAAIKRYQEATGQSVNPSELFIPIDSTSGEGYEMLTGPDFERLAQWRAGEIAQLIWDLSAQIKRLRPNIQVGLEVTPEMILEQDLALKWYSTGLHYLKNQMADFYILKWRKYNSDAESDLETYRRALSQLEGQLPSDRVVYGKIPLSDGTRNIIRFNERIQEQLVIREDFENVKIAIGPVSRLRKQDFLRSENQVKGVSVYKPR